jgi:hypothetical protein
MNTEIYGESYVTNATWDKKNSTSCNKGKKKHVDYSTLDTIVIVGCKYYIDDINGRLVFIESPNCFMFTDKEEIESMKLLIKEFPNDYNFSFDLKKTKHNTYIPKSFFQKIDKIGNYIQIDPIKNSKTGTHIFHI